MEGIRKTPKIDDLSRIKDEMLERNACDNVDKSVSKQMNINNGDGCIKTEKSSSEDEPKLEKNLSRDGVVGGTEEDDEDDEDDDEEEEEEEEKASDDEPENKVKSDEKRDDDSSTTSTSTSDDESETSSEDKTEPSSKPEEAPPPPPPPLTLPSEKSKDSKEESPGKNDDITDDSDIDDDLVSTINYNTITSLAALKDMLQSTGEDSESVDSFFHHYFLSHVNRLPSRNQTHSPYPWGRRLSECREEDEDETEDGGKVNETNGEKSSTNDGKSIKTQESQDKSESLPSKASSLSSSEKSSSEKIDQKSNATTSSISESRPPPTASTGSRFTTTIVTSPTSNKPPLRRRHTTGPGMTFPATDPPNYPSNLSFSRTSPLPSPHFDKRFFDSSLIEMKSQASSSSTLDYDSNDEIWVRRIDPIQDKKRRELGSQPLPTIVTEDADHSSNKSEDQGFRQRAGTWGSHSRTIKKSATGSAPSSGKSTPLPQQVEPTSSSSGSMKFMGRKTSGTRSNSNSRSNSRSNSVERRRSDDTPSPTRKNALFDAFRPRSKSDASKTRKPSIIANMKNAVQSLHRGSVHGHSTNDVSVEKDSHKIHKDQKDTRENREHVGRPRSGSECIRNPVSKVIDLIRHRSHSAITAKDERKRAANQYQSQSASQGAQRRSSVDPGHRRLSLGTPALPHRASDACLDPIHAAMLFRDARGTTLTTVGLRDITLVQVSSDSQRT